MKETTTGELTEALINFYDFHKQIVPVLKWLIAKEIRNPST